MNRKIIVKGTGYASVEPDLLVVTLVVNSKDIEYETAMQKATEASHQLADALEGVHFTKEDLKTTDFNVNTAYKSVKDTNGNYQSIFNGYKVHQTFRLEFALDFNQLAKAITAISKLTVEPELNIQFTVKDSAGVSEALLKSATQNAKKNAMILADASGVQLGDLIHIDYNWSRIDLYSQTDYRMRASSMKLSEEINPHIVPEDIDVTDTVTFVWEIK